MAARYSNVELLDVVNDQHRHSDDEIAMAADLLVSRGVISEAVAERKVN